MLSFRWHALGVFLLLLVGAVEYRDALFAHGALGDEHAYLCAGQAVAAGRSLSECPAYLYGPALARLAGAIVRHGGDSALLAALRSSIWLGAAFTVWCSLGLTRSGLVTRLVLGALVIAFWPPVQQSLSLGNLSPTTAALALAGLLCCERYAIAGGVLLALAITSKPLPAAAPAILVATSLGVWWRSRRLESKPLVAGLLAAGLVAVIAWWSGGFPSAPRFSAAAENPITIVRVLAALGVELPSLVVFLLVVLLGSLYAMWRPRTGTARLGLAIVVSLLSSPLVWCHTWLLATPLIALAADRTLFAYRSAPAGTPERSRALLDLLVVALASFSLSVSDAFGFVAHGTAANALFVAMPLVAPAALLFYAENTRFRTASSQGEPQPHSSAR